MLVLSLVALLIIVLGSWPIWALAQHIRRSKDYALFARWQTAKLRQPELYAAQLCRGSGTFCHRAGNCSFEFADPVRSDLAQSQFIDRITINCAVTCLYPGRTMQ